jgi:hypothetical protein
MPGVLAPCLASLCDALHHASLSRSCFDPVPQTSRSHLQLYALNVSSEALWRLPDGQELRRVNLYLSHSLHMDYGAVTVADLGGDARSLLVVLSNGTMQVFSWQGQVSEAPRRGWGGGRGSELVCLALR